ncbi:MAG: hypothetical protein ACI3X0_04250, partial [Butyricicoccus sp.]
IEKLVECFSITLEALDFVLDFIEINGLKTPERIDYINYLLGYFVFHGCEVNDSTREFLINWYENVDFTNKSNTDRRDIFNALIGG